MINYDRKNGIIYISFGKAKNSFTEPLTKNIYIRTDVKTNKITGITVFKEKFNIKKLSLYILRWQMSTPILYLCMIWLPFSPLLKTILANLIGALIFFKIDQWIMRR